jgi:hypothetical protein
MPDLEGTLAALNSLVRREAALERERRKLLEDATQSKAFRDESDAHILKQAESIRREKVRWLSELTRYPPFHDRHFGHLATFHANGSKSFEKSVFVMTKYPDPGAPLNGELMAVIQAVRDAITASGYIPRLASEASFHPILWDNVELYLLGCSRAVAVLESIYKPELNPNVAMEWGWMRGMGRDILPLVEQTFGYQRADWGGLIEHRFDWKDPTPGISTAVASWLAAASANNGARTVTP